MAGPDLQFWQSRFERGETPWDRAASSPQLLRWLDADELEPCRVLVPGCGVGHEVVELARRGFDVTALDYAPAALAPLRARLASLNLQAQIVEADALQWQTPAPFDAIYEQTAMCALHPDQWITYTAKIFSWLRPGGNLFALFAQVLRPRAAQGFIEGPPYHCDIHAMRALFPEHDWVWPKPPYESVDHPGIATLRELAIVLCRR